MFHGMLIRIGKWTPPLYSTLLLPLHPQCILSWNSRNLSKQLLFDSGSSSPGAVFLLPVDLGLGAAVGGMRLEINTGCSCYSICNNSRHKMALQSITKLNSYSSFSDILVFVCLCLCLSHVFVIVFVFSIFTPIFHDILAKFSMASTPSRKVNCFWQ